AWFPAAFKYLNVDLGVEFIELLRRWVEFERFFGWSYTREGLASSNRPQELSNWIKSGRYKAKYGGSGPKLTGIARKQFSSALDVWWHSLKPKGDNWTLLNHHGPNGWLSLLVGLKWWGLAMENEELEAKKEWLDIVLDMSMILDALLQYQKQRE
ncbi:hypothetical protein K435DRAFT_669150, partial [Dendrothele bispora CBS 962.96]